MEITAARRAVSEARLYGILDLSYVAADDALDMTRRMIDGGVQILQTPRQEPAARPDRATGEGSRRPHQRRRGAFHHQ